MQQNQTLSQQDPIQVDANLDLVKKRKKSFNEEVKKELQEKNIAPVMGFVQTDIQVPNIQEQKRILESIEKQNTIIVGICGGSSSGKSFITNWLKNKFKEINYSVQIIKEKNFIIPVKPDSKNESMDELLLIHDFDNYDAIDWPLFETTLSSLQNNQETTFPVYDIFNNQRFLKHKTHKPSDLIIIEGRIFLNNPQIVQKCNMKIFLETDLDLMLSRIVIKGCTRMLKLETIIQRYLKFIKPSYEKWIEPTKGCADIVIPNFGQGQIDIQQFQQNYEVLQILMDLLEFRVKDQAGKSQQSNKLYISFLQ